MTSGPASVFLGVALFGPLAACAWYWVAVAQYRTVTDLLRSSVDLFRFELLAAFRYPSPDSVEEERYLWQAIDALHVHYEFRDLRYARPRS
jgi:hypothetical protein